MITERSPEAKRAYVDGFKAAVDWAANRLEGFPTTKSAELRASGEMIASMIQRTIDHDERKTERERAAEE